MTTYRNLLQQIDDASLSKILPRLIRLAQRAKDRDLENWARLEFLGYWQSNPALKESTVVPEYRTVPGQWMNQFGQRILFPDPNLAIVNEIRLRAGVVELEGMVGAQGSLAYHLPDYAEILATIGVDASIFNFSPSSVSVVMAAIRTRASDYLVERCTALESLAEPIAEDSEDEVLELRPNIYGFGINLKALWRRLASSRGNWRKESD